MTKIQKKSLARVRGDFPSLRLSLNAKPIAFLDSAASSQKPHCVMQAMQSVLEGPYANIHRGLYAWSQDLTTRFEAARAHIARFIGAPSPDEIIFTRGATEGINLIAHAWGRTHLREGDEVILSVMEHHANIVPWQFLQKDLGIVLKIIPIDSYGDLDLAAFERLLTHRTKLVSVTHVSNVLGTINPIERIVAIAKDFYPDMVVVIDGAQGIVHAPIDVAALGADFYVFSGHKLYGPTGIGVLWGRAEILESMPPWQGGGDMIEAVDFEEGTTFKPPPARFEAGTPAIAQVLGLSAAIAYLENIGMTRIAQAEQALLAYATERLLGLEGVRLYGTSAHKAGVLSFTMDGLHPADIASILDQCGVAVRAGHHCCMPLMRHLGVTGTVRASLGLYSDQNDIDRLIEGLTTAKRILT